MLELEQMLIYICSPKSNIKNIWIGHCQGQSREHHRNISQTIYYKQKYYNRIKELSVKTEHTYPTC